LPGSLNAPRVVWRSPTASAAKGRALYQAVVDADLEGIVAKKLADPYKAHPLAQNSESRLLAAPRTLRMVRQASRPAPSSDLVDRLLCYRVDPADRARLALARRRSRPLGSRSPSISSTDDTLSAGSRALMFSWLDKRPGQCGEHRTGPDPRQREFAMPKAVRNYARPRIPRLLNRRSRQRTN